MFCGFESLRWWWGLLVEIGGCFVDEFVYERDVIR